MGNTKTRPGMEYLSVEKQFCLLPPMGNGRLIQLEGFKSMDVWAVEGYQPVGKRLRRFRTMIILRPRPAALHSTAVHHHHHQNNNELSNNNNNLTLINVIRLSISDEQELLKLGSIAYVVRLSSEDAGFDDLYYIQKFAARAFAYRTVGQIDRQQPWNAGPHWTFFNATSTTSSTIECFRGLSPVFVLDVPLVMTLKTSHSAVAKTEEEQEHECVLYFPNESTLIVSQFMQNNDFTHSNLYGMTLSRLKLTIWEIICLKLTGFGGHLHTPKPYLDRLMRLSSSNDNDETNMNHQNTEQLDLFLKFHGQLMDLKWDRVLCLYGGPTMYSAKRFRRESIRTWPLTAYGTTTTNI